MATATAPAPLKKKTKVVLAVDVPGIAAGTEGRVFMVTGLTWTRYWVRFDGGVIRGSLDRRVLQTPDEWSETVRRRETGEDDVEAEAPDGGAGGEDGGADEAAASAGEGVTVGGVTVPAHLLERSKSRRQALGA